MPTRVLFVEDEPDVRLVISQGLKFYGMEVEEADSAETALKKLRYQQPDVILLDMGLPGMSGWEFARKLSRGSYQHIPIVALTAASHVGDEQKALQVGCSAFIPKPAEPSTVKRVIEEALVKGRKL